MKFLAVFVALVAVAFGAPTISTWTINELAAALHDPNTDPAHIPYLEQALDQLMDALYAGDDKPSITVVIPAQPELPVIDSDNNDFWPIPIPADVPDHIIVEGPTPVWPIPIPADVPDHIIVEGPTPVDVAPTAASSPLVQIIVNVKQATDVIAPVAVDDTPSPVHIVEQPLPGWGNFI